MKSKLLSLAVLLMAGTASGALAQDQPIQNGGPMYNAAQQAKGRQAQGQTNPAERQVQHGPPQSAPIGPPQAPQAPRAPQAQPLQQAQQGPYGWNGPQGGQPGGQPGGQQGGQPGGGADNGRPPQSGGNPQGGNPHGGGRPQGGGQPHGGGQPAQQAPQGSYGWNGPQGGQPGGRPDGGRPPQGGDHRDRDHRDGDHRNDGRQDWSRPGDGRGQDWNRDHGRGPPRDAPQWAPRRYPPIYNSPSRYQGGYWRPPSGYYARAWRYGEVLPRGWYGPDYLLGDWWGYGLPEPPPGYDWVRVGRDALLIDYSGRIVQVVRSVFW